MNLDPELVSQALRILPSVAFWWVQRRRVPWLYDEVFSEGLAVLPELLERYKPERSKLRKYLFWSVTQRLTDWWRNSGDKSRVGARVPRLCDKRRDWDEAFHRPMVRIGYIDKGGDHKARFAEDVLLATHDSGPEHSDLRDLVKALLLRVSPRERELLLLHYFEELTYREIGQVLNLTESRVCQMEKLALRRIRDNISQKKRRR